MTDRVLIPLNSLGMSTSINTIQQNMLVAVGDIFEATFGNGTVVWGLGCVPSSPASLIVNVNRGGITSLQEVDASAPGSGLINSNSTVKAGVLHAPLPITLAAPATAGQSVNYLVEVKFDETDTNPLDLDYVDPTTLVKYTGNVAVNTVRVDTAALQVKNGTAATTGTQTTPGVDAGWQGLWVVTVNYGQTQILANNIVQYPGVPWASNTFLPPSNYLTVANAANTFVALSQLSTGSTALSVPQRDSGGGLTATAFHGNADTASFANSAGFANSATSATTAANATFANSAGTATTATSAATANVATLATTATNAITASTANNALQLGGLGYDTAATPSTNAQRDAAANLTANEFLGLSLATLFSDIAERYEAAEPLEPGDVVEFGRINGKGEIRKATSRVFSVVSTNPGQKLNGGAGTDLTHPYVCLDGRVPVKVMGTASYGDFLVLHDSIPGVAVAYSDPKWASSAFGTVLADKTDPELGLIEASVKRGF